MGCQNLVCTWSSATLPDGSTAIEMPPSCLLEVARLDLEQYAMIYMNMARELSRRMRHADERLLGAMLEARIGEGDFDFSSG